MKPIIATADLRIADIMNPHTQVLAPDSALGVAVELMSRQHISCLIVEADASPVGILTERDMVRLLHAGTDLTRPIGEVMTQPVVTVRENLDFRAAYGLLRHKSIRHLIVTDENNQTRGIVSETDFRNHLGRDVFHKIQNMSATMDRDILSLGPDDSLKHALNRMIQEKWDYVIVVQDNKPLGIVTERDIPGLLARHTAPDQITLREVMTSPVFTVPINASVTDTITTMGQKHVRHMVVVSAEGNVAGVISQHRVLELLGLEVLEDAWRASEEQYRAVVNSIREVIYQTDTEGRWSFLNPAWESITGYPVEESIGSLCLDFLVPEDQAAYRTQLHHLMTGQITEFREELRFKQRQGSDCWVELHARLTRGRDGLPIGSTGTLFNISERKAAEFRLQEAARAEAAAHRAKSQFLANMSHELRTPLNGILGMSDLLQMSALDTEHAEYAHIIHQSAKSLMGVINQILEFSSLEQNGQVVHETPFNPMTLGTSLKELFAPEVNLKKLSLDLCVADNVPKFVCADHNRLRIVLINILANAVKFTPEGAIHLSIGLATPDSSCPSPQLVITIKDTGIGMSTAVCDHLFDPDYSGEEFTTRSHDGTGLGLKICQRHLTVMGGTISVRSSRGEGSIFTVTIPVKLS